MITFCLSGVGDDSNIEVSNFMRLLRKNYDVKVKPAVGFHVICLEEYMADDEFEKVSSDFCNDPE